MKTHTPELRCFINKPKDILNVLYYNPDGCFAHGQYVWIKIPKSEIENNIDYEIPDEYFSEIIETSAKCYLIDHSDNPSENKEFEYTDKLFKTLTVIPDLNKNTLEHIFENKNIKIL